MSVLYKIYQDTRKKKGTSEPANPKTFGKWFARTLSIATIESKDMAEKIAYSASATPADTLAVINALIKVMADSLKDGYVVKLDGFGAWRIGISTSAVDAPEDFSASKNINGAHVNFMPEYTIDNASGKAIVPMLAGLKLQEAVKN